MRLFDDVLLRRQSPDLPFYHFLDHFLLDCLDRSFDLDPVGYPICHRRVPWEIDPDFYHGHYCGYICSRHRGLALDLDPGLLFARIYLSHGQNDLWDSCLDR